MKNLLCILFMLHALAADSQVVVVDKDNVPIPFVHVVVNNGYFITQTNLNGELKWSDVQHLHPADSLLFRHISYEPVRIAFKSLTDLDTIRLAERSYGLNEVHVFSNSIKGKYQKMSACYRSYQTSNDTISHYTDGNVEYLSKRDKRHFDLFIRNSRTMVNDRLEAERRKRKTEVLLQPGVPYPPADCLPYQYAKRYRLRYMPKESDGSQLLIYNTNNAVVGRLEDSDGFVKYSILDSSFVGTNKLANTEIERVRKEVFMVFKSDSTVGRDISSFDNLLYAKILLEYRIKHNRDNQYTRIYRVDEIFVEDVLSVDSFEKGKYKNGYGMPKASNYLNRFWETCSCPLYTQPAEQITTDLNEK
jgi:hypothetical protein